MNKMRCSMPTLMAAYLNIQITLNATELNRGTIFGVILLIHGIDKWSGPRLFKTNDVVS